MNTDVYITLLPIIHYYLRLLAFLRMTQVSETMLSDIVDFSLTANFI